MFSSGVCGVVYHLFKKDNFLFLKCSFWLQKVLSSEHFMGNRMLEVKVATPKVTFSPPLSVSI